MATVVRDIVTCRWGAGLNVTRQLENSGTVEKCSNVGRVLSNKDIETSIYFSQFVVEQLASESNQNILVVTLQSHSVFAQRLNPFPFPFIQSVEG